MDSFLLLRRLVAAIVFKGQTVSDYWWSRRTIFLTGVTKINVDTWKGWTELILFEEKEQGENSVVLLLNSSYIRGAVAVLYSVPCHHS